jgi:hypothetical protein
MPRRVLSVLGIALFAATGCVAADAGKLPGATWDSIQKLPDLNGVWEITFGNGFPGLEEFSLTPKYLALLQEFRTAPAHDTPMANCVPPGMPNIMTQPYPIEILYTPGMVTVIAEAFMQVRHIYTDGRGHPEDPDLTFNGHSIGHWENDTLVADSLGFTKDTPLGMRTRGTRHSDKMHIVERFHLKDPKTLEITTTIDDPEALAKPWTRTLSFTRHRDWTLTEYICQQNNRNSLDASGKAGINLEH